MLSGKHYKKKADKRSAKKAKKAAAKEPQQQQQQAANRNQTASTLKGPVVSYGDHHGARDAGNDRRGLPVRGGGGRARGRGRGRGAAAQPVTPAPKSSMASSAAQRRLVQRKGGDDLLNHFRQKLEASTFRLLNEQLYNSPNAYAAQLLRDPETFNNYHTGYRIQLEQWPVSPPECMATALLTDRLGRFTASSTPAANASKAGIPLDWTVVDMGCGTAIIAAKMKPLGYTNIHSYDLCALNEHVEVADTTKIPLPSSSVDVCLFSLSLMATDYERSLFEALRLLKPHRLLKIIEVRSRIPDPSRFAAMVCSMGFTAEYQDVVGDYFVAFDFTKKEGISANHTPDSSRLAFDPSEVLLPSMYKKR